MVVGPAKRLVPLPQFLVTSEGSLHGRTLVISQDEQILGRREGSPLHLEDPHVSRAHAVVRRQSGVVVLEDLGSTGGTFVNGEAVKGAQALRHNDLVRFGTVETRFEDRGSLMESEDATDLIEIPPVEEKPVLSPRQQEVLFYLREGLTNPEIAVRLGVTERTIKAHCQEVFDRLGARNRTAAVASAMRLGLFEDD
ncbi:MAG: FHA domain-containing protein [Nitriliruptorales bacterium]|nr:FHA domain-containing protein [Nitriliruptorales bacterium]